MTLMTAVIHRDFVLCCRSLVAAWRNGSVDIISPEGSSRRIPSYVAFRDGRLLIGEEAKSQVSRNATNTVFSIKRLVGADPARPEVQNIVKHWPFKVMFETRNRTVVAGAIEDSFGGCTPSLLPAASLQ
jgi:molecular chaperone DnaK (HSP70)